MWLSDHPLLPSWYFFYSFHFHKNPSFSHNDKLPKPICSIWTRNCDVGILLLMHDRTARKEIICYCANKNKKSSLEFSYCGVEYAKKIICWLLGVVWSFSKCVISKCLVSRVIKAWDNSSSTVCISSICNKTFAYAWLSFPSGFDVANYSYVVLD